MRYRLLALLAGLSVLTLLWYAFLTLGAAVAVDTHFTYSPERVPGCRLTPWRLAPAGSSSTDNGARQIRDAVLSSTFFTIRYTQAGDGSGGLLATEYAGVQPRWGPVSAAMALSLVVPLGLYFLGRRLIRLLTQGRSPSRGFTILVPPPSQPDESRGNGASPD